MSARKLWNLVCSANGCVFLREGLGKREAALEAQSHARLCPGHDVLLVPQKGPEAAGN